MVVQRVFDESEKDDVNDKESDDEFEDDETEKEWTFLIDEALHITYSVTSEKQVVVIWRHLSGEPGDHFEFVCDKATNEAVLEKFDLVARKCQYERKFRKASSDASTADLEAFDFELDDLAEVKSEPKTTREIAPPGTPVATKSQSTSDARKVDPAKEPSTPAPKSRSAASSEPPVTPAKQTEQTAPEPEVITEINGFKIYEAKVSLHLFDPVPGVFVEQLSTADLAVYDQDNFEFWLEVNSPSQKFIGVLVTSEMNPVFNYEHLSFIFNLFTENSAFSWLIKFSTFEELENYQNAFMQALWETTNRQKWIKVTPDERDYLAEAFQDFEMKDADIDLPDDDEEMEDEEHSSCLQRSTAADEHDYDEGYDEVKKMDGQGKNSQLAVGNKNDRTFVLRDNKLGVFKQTTDNELEFQTTIDNIATTKGKSFVPQKLMLHTQDRAMVMQDPENLNSLYRMDIEYGKVVDEWEISENHKVKAFAPSQKFSQGTDEQTFLGVSDKALFRIDPRLSGTKLVESQLKNYATKVDFSALATTEKGYVAVASNKGEIRLYDRLGINAKTQLPAMGDAIIGIDVSSDGKWILATCKTYLLLIDATIKDGKNEGQVGFLKSFGKDSKPRPKRLQISPEHLAHMQAQTGSPLSFTIAHFNTGLDKREQSIVTSSGPFVISWSLKKILRGDKSPYLIKRYSDNVAADNFKFGSDKNVIIALENDVGMVDRRTFRKPTRESLATPARRIQAMSRNSIVNSPY